MTAQILFIARRDLAYMLRQRETLLWTFLMPGLFFYFIGTVTGGMGHPSGSAERPDPIALDAPAHAGAIIDEFARRLGEQRFRVIRAGDEAFERQRRRIVVPAPAAGFASVTAQVEAGEPLAVTLEQPGDNLATTFDQFRVSRALYAVLADLAVLRGRGDAVTPEAFARIAAMPRALTVEVTAAGARRDPPSGFGQAVPGTMVMFTMLVLLTSGVILLVVERDQGLLRRLASTPIPAGAVIAGKWIARMALALVQIAFAMALGRVLFGVDWGPAAWMILVVLGGWAALNASLALVLGSLVRTPPQAAGIGVLSSMTLAALGGCWWPIEITPSWMQSLAMALPTGWAMDALHRLMHFGDGASAVLPHAAALAATALLLGWIGAKTFRYQ
jgi:ABC-type Na+ efflux pump permease subunit